FSHADRPLFINGCAIAGCKQSGAVENARECSPFLSKIDRFGSSAEDGYSIVLQRLREPECGLTTELDDHTDNLAVALFRMNDFKHIFQCEWLKIETI